MKTLNIKLKVKDKVEAYKALNRLARRYKIKSAKFYNRKKEKFGKKNKPKDFLKNENK